MWCCHRIFVLSVYLCASSLLLKQVAMDDAPDNQKQDPPCQHINPLCTCSATGRINLGRVTCYRQPFDVIIDFNSTRVYSLRLEHNGLSSMGPDHWSALNNTAINMLSINHNPLTRIPAGSFNGLEGSLRVLDLSNNQLHHFPGSSIKNLTRLEKLDLQNNQLAIIQKDDLEHVDIPLKELILKNNLLLHLPTDLFSHLIHLTTLDLSGNRLSMSLDNIFRQGPQQLSLINLSDNQLRSIPFGLMANAQALKTIDLSHNLIKSTNDIDELSIFSFTHQGSIRIEHVILDSNHIHQLSTRSFQLLKYVEKLSLDNNPIVSIADGAFWSMELNELSVRSCDIKQLSPGALKGLEKRLKYLDMSHNTIDAEVLSKVVTNLTVLQQIALTGTNVGLLPAETLLNSRDSLTHLRMESSGKWENTGGALRMSALQKLKNLRLLGLAQFPTTSLSGFEFRGQSPTIEILSLRGSNIRALESDAFMFLAGLRILDMSSNHLDSVHPDTFRKIGHSLDTLDMSDAFLSSVSTLPSRFFQPLVNVRYLNLANNRFTHFHVQTFHNNIKLKILNLEDNSINDIKPGTFKGDRQTNLNTIRLSFNRLSHLGPSSFVGLYNLKRIELNDNHIETISKNAFVNLDKLEQLNLKGNRLSDIEFDALQNLPQLSQLDLSYNHLQMFNLGLFDQLGEMTSLMVNISHNLLTHLQASTRIHINVNIRSLDFSNNHISTIEQRYFDPIKWSLMQLILSHNRIQNITKNTLKEMVQLHTLNLDNNRLIDIDQEAFAQNRQLQLLTINNNMLINLPPAIFSSCVHLRRLDLSSNRLNELPIGLFHNIQALEHLNVASNLLKSFPINILSSSASTITSLDMSNNLIRHVSEAAFKSFVNLLKLDLSSNNMHAINVNQLLLRIPNVRWLSLNNNPLNALKEVQSQSLEELHLRGMSLNRLPLFTTPNLLKLDISKNRITVTSSDNVFQNSTDIRWLDISENRLQTLASPLWSTVPRLLHLSLAYNPLNDISNNSFTHFRLLDSLELHGVTIKDTLRQLKSLRSLSMDYHSSVDTLKTVSDLDGLDELTLHIRYTGSFALKQHQGQSLPSKLRTVNLIGKHLSHFDSDAFQAVTNRNPTLRLRHTSVSHLERRIFNGNIRQLQLDLTDNSLVSVEDMVTSEQPGAQGLFLMDLKLQDNLWACDSCETIGWIANWMRQLRQRVCHVETGVRCLRLEDELRASRCNNHQPIIDVFKNDFDCEWKSVGISNTISLLNSLITPIILLVITLSDAVWLV